MSVLRFEKRKINEELPLRYSFICFSSFEKRCLTIPFALKKECINHVYVLRNMEKIAINKNEENTRQIKSLFSNVEVVPVDIQKSISIVNAMAKMIYELIQREEKVIIIDISTFTHEALLILIRLIYDNRNSFEYLKCLYNGASSYSYGDKFERMWLSKGCRDVRNVMGYPGKIVPKKKDHVIVLTGFETERATRMVELLSPDKLTLANGNEPTEEEHDEVMKFFKGKFDKWKNNFLGILEEPLSFSCRDVEKTIDILKEKTKESEDNFILVPLNTKLSTIAVGIVALSNIAIQVCYAIPEMYNMDNYSEPSNNITVLDMQILFEKIGE